MVITVRLPAEQGALVLKAIASAADAARAEREAPGLARAPARAYATLVTILAHASSLAEDVARELEPSTTTTQSTMGDAKP